jgi:hypothetical protein
MRFCRLCTSCRASYDADAPLGRGGGPRPRRSGSARRGAARARRKPLSRTRPARRLRTSRPMAPTMPSRLASSWRIAGCGDPGTAGLGEVAQDQGLLRPVLWRVGVRARRAGRHRPDRPAPRPPERCRPAPLALDAQALGFRHQRIEGARTDRAALAEDEGRAGFHAGKRDDAPRTSSPRSPRAAARARPGPRRGSPAWRRGRARH